MKITRQDIIKEMIQNILEDHNINVGKIEMELNKYNMSPLSKLTDTDKSITLANIYKLINEYNILNLKDLIKLYPISIFYNTIHHKDHIIIQPMTMYKDENFIKYVTINGITFKESNSCYISNWNDMDNDTISLANVGSPLIIFSLDNTGYFITDKNSIKIKIYDGKDNVLSKNKFSISEIINHKKIISYIYNILKKNNLSIDNINIKSSIGKIFNKKILDIVKLKLSDNFKVQVIRDKDVPLCEQQKKLLNDKFGKSNWIENPIEVVANKKVIYDELIDSLPNINIVLVGYLPIHIWRTIHHRISENNLYVLFNMELKFKINKKHRVEYMEIPDKGWSLKNLI